MLKTNEKTIVDFPRELKEELTYDDKIIILARGQGLKLIDYPDVMLYNLDPGLLGKMKIKKSGKAKLKVPIDRLRPAFSLRHSRRLLGQRLEWIGSFSGFSSDYLRTR